MDKYIGTKIVLAEPQNKFDSGCDCTIDEHGHSRSGYKIVYEDGYTSWSPKETFERAYRKITEAELELLQPEKTLEAALDWLRINATHKAGCVPGFQCECGLAELIGNP